MTPETAGVATGTKVHDGLGAVPDCHIHLLIFHIPVLGITGSTQIYIYLGGKGVTDTVGIKSLVVLICRYDHLTLGDKSAQLLRIHMLLSRHLFHLGSDDPPSGSIHLCCIFSFHNVPLFF